MSPRHLCCQLFPKQGGCEAKPPFPAVGCVNVTKADLALDPDRFDYCLEAIAEDERSQIQKP
jgi:hypothetical protein